MLLNFGHYSVSCSHKNGSYKRKVWGRNQCLYLGIRVVLVLRPVHTVATVEHPVTGDPLVSILSRLGQDLGDLNRPVKVHLDPLSVVIIPGRPRPGAVALPWYIKPCSVRPVVIVPPGR